MTKTTLKQGNKCFTLCVNLTQSYISFKIEQGVFLGSTKNLSKTCSGYYAVEHPDDTVNYLQLEDIHKTERAAYKALVVMLNKKLSNTKLPISRES